MTDMPDLTNVDMTREELAKMIDHSLLRPELTNTETIEGIKIGLEYNVATVTVKPYMVPVAVEMVKGSEVLVDPVVSFPHGTDTTEAKAFMARQLVDLGAGEIDMVINIGALIEGEYDYVLNDIAAVVEASQGKTVKVILENAYLTDEQKVKGCQLVEKAGAHFVKTSTGFAPTGYTYEDLVLMRKSVSDKVQVKAAQGVRSYEGALIVKAAGGTRFGCTRTVKIFQEWEEAHSGK
jgi:deoxyribose-phosphate aldolase